MEKLCAICGIRLGTTLKNAEDPGQLALTQMVLNSVHPKHLNESTFVYRVVFDEAGNSIWGLMFFGAHLAIATASAPAHLAGASQVPTHYE